MAREDDSKKRAGPTDAAHATPWAAPPSGKARGGVQRAVTELLDALAPERVVSRAPRIPVPVERHRTPQGCVLQAAATAVSVTWFPDTTADATLGALQVTAWRGVVSRPGSAHRTPGGASVVRELALVPVEDGPNGWRWRAADGTSYDTDALVARCAAMLEELARGAGG
jgi:hypothetical protein